MKELVSSNYSIWIGNDSLSKIDISSYSKIAILVDENTEKFCLKELTEIENSIIIKIKSGEKNKTINTCNFIWQELINHQFDRDSLLINLGGGVICDIGGFCASIYKRGIDFIQIPTTLLAMVDASIGGKLGVNFDKLKNQIGIFKNPKSVFIYPPFINTLEKKELYSGFAEIVKHALISDKNLWKEITSSSIDKLDLNKIIVQSINIKNEIVLKDQYEKRERKKLNFGHTFGHAIESFYLEKRSPILHGEAIFIGMILEVELSPIDTKEKNEIKNYILSNFNLPPTPEKVDLLMYLNNDKKNKQGKINFSLLKEIGNACYDNLILIDEL